MCCVIHIYNCSDQYVAINLYVVHDYTLSMIYIAVGILLGFLIVYIVVNVIDWLTRVEPIEIDEEDACSDPIFDVIKCPECYCYNYDVCYVDPLFNRGKYARCRSCGCTWDLEEDGSCGTLEKTNVL